MHFRCSARPASSLSLSHLQANLPDGTRSRQITRFDRHTALSHTSFADSFSGFVPAVRVAEALYGSAHPLTAPCWQCCNGASERLSVGALIGINFRPVPRSTAVDSSQATERRPSCQKRVAAKNCSSRFRQKLRENSRGCSSAPPHTHRQLSTRAARRVESLAEPRPHCLFGPQPPSSALSRGRYPHVFSCCTRVVAKLDPGSLWLMNARLDVCIACSRTGSPAIQTGRQNTPAVRTPYS